MWFKVRKGKDGEERKERKVKKDKKGKDKKGKGRQRWQRNYERQNTAHARKERCTKKGDYRRSRRDHVFRGRDGQE